MLPSDHLESPMVSASEKKSPCILSIPTFWPSPLAPPDIAGRPGRRTMEMNGGTSASYLARSPCVPSFSSLKKRSGSRRALRLPGEGGDHFHCARWNLCPVMFGVDSWLRQRTRNSKSAPWEIGFQVLQCYCRKPDIGWTYLKASNFHDDGKKHQQQETLQLYWLLRYLCSCWVSSRSTK